MNDLTVLLKSHQRSQLPLNKAHILGINGQSFLTFSCQALQAQLYVFSPASLGSWHMELLTSCCLSAPAFHIYSQSLECFLSLLLSPNSCSTSTSLLPEAFHQLPLPSSSPSTEFVPLTQCYVFI